jgi:hypothetical protein
MQCGFGVQKKKRIFKLFQIGLSPDQGLELVGANTAPIVTCSVDLVTIAGGRCDQ